jgi:ankyrin repeat protein
LDTVKLILSNGASVNSRDVVGNSALSLARDSGQSEMVQLIEGSRNGLGALFR